MKTISHEYHFSEKGQNAQTPDQIDEADYRSGVERKSEKRMGKAAMMGETEGRTAETAEYVEIGRLGGERKGERSQRSLAVESGAAQARAREEMRYGFQGLRILFGCVHNCQPR